MATTLTLNSLVSIFGTYESGVSLNDCSSDIFVRVFNSYANGAGTGTANKWWANSYTVANGATTSIDLTGGVTDNFGNTLTFTRLKLLLVVRTDSNQGTGAVSGTIYLALAGDVTFKNYLSAGGLYYQAAPTFGVAIANGVSDTLTIEGPASLGPIDVNVYIAGY